MSQIFSNIFTFQNMLPVPPPPPPPPMTQELSDQAFVKSFESQIEISKKRKLKINCGSISQTKYCLASLVSAIRDIKAQEKLLAGNNLISDEEWKSALESIKTNKYVIDSTIKRVTGTFIEINRKVLTRRAAKRRRQKRQRLEYKEEKKRIVKEREENSRRINENLVKIKENLERAKMEQESKCKADMVLKEVLRKKHDAKKSMEKLDALFKLRLARQNSAKGKGQLVQEQGSVAFADNLKRLKSLWTFKLASYEVEEEQLRKKLELNKDKDNTTEIEKLTTKNLSKWQKSLFGIKSNPQVDFNGDVAKFINVRSEWDGFIDTSHEASPIPIGWVHPTA